MKHGRNPYTSPTYKWKGTSAVFYSSSVTSYHSHNTMQLVLDIQKDFRFKVKDGDWCNYKSLIIKENVIHKLDTNGSVQLIIYLDADTEIGRSIKSEFLSDRDTYSLDWNIFHWGNSNELQQALLCRDASILADLIDRILLSLSRKIEISRKDKRILKTEQFISTAHPLDVNLPRLSDMACLSPSRLRSLFKEVTGVSLYQYILWNKIRFATNQIMSGDSVNDAAIGAGFTDSSHFHKMMTQVFGISPSRFLKDNMNCYTVNCDDTLLRFETSYYNRHHWTVERTVLE